MSDFLAERLVDILTNSKLREYISGAQTALSGSVIWGLLTRLHLYFRKSFASSGIIGAVKKEGGAPLVKSSLLCRILGLPLFIVSYFTKTFSGFVRSFSKNSVLSALSKGFVNGFLSLNVSFFGLMLLSGGAVGSVLALLRGGKSRVFLAAAAVGLILSFVKVRLSKYIDKSVFVRFIKSSFGFENDSFCPPQLSCEYGYTVISAVIAGAAGGVLSAVNPLLAALPIALFGVLAIMFFPMFGLALSIFFAPILPTMAVVGLCVLTTVSSVLQKSYRGDFKIKCQRAGLSLLAFLAVLLISTLFSYSRGGSVGVFGMYMIFIAFYFTIVNEVNSEKALKTVLKLFVISGAVVSVYGIMQYLFGWTTKNAWIDTEMFEDATMRVYSTLANPNVLGEYLLLALPVGVLCFTRLSKGVWQRVVYALMTAAMLLCLVLTQSRGCWIGFFVSAFILVTYYKSELWKLLPVFLLLLPLVLPETIINRFLSVGNMSDSSTSYRVFIWLGTLLMLRDFWLGGIGLGEKTFRTIYPYYSYVGITAPHSHNLYLQLVVESGIAGLLMFAAVMVIFFKDCINAGNRSRKAGAVSYALAAGVLGFLVQSMFDYTFYNYRVMGIFFMVLALGAAVKNIAGGEALNEKNN